MGRRPAEALPIPMSDDQYTSLAKIASRHTTPQQISKRANILLLASKGEAHFTIRQKIGVSLNTIKLWRRRWIEADEELTKLDNETDLLKVLPLFLKDLPRAGAPNKFTEAQKQQIVALACDRPTNHDIEMIDWTHEMLALTAQAKGIVESISTAHVGRILKNTALTTT